ncbi:hypothetical protein [Pseudomonas sp. FEN]|nr:hypothetical protein [Pseudomonas sp. FEN]CAD5202199.1 hypothetical protein [Pseudomonas sp. FEN]
MHEIPNFPFPSLHETEQKNPPKTAAQQPVNKEAKDSLKANSKN